MASFTTFKLTSGGVTIDKAATGCGVAEILAYAKLPSTVEALGLIGNVSFPFLSRARYTMLPYLELSLDAPATANDWCSKNELRGFFIFNFCGKTFFVANAIPRGLAHAADSSLKSRCSVVSLTGVWRR